jgi:hypothetical protein
MDWTNAARRVTYPDTVWFPFAFMIDFSIPGCGVVFNGYASEDAARKALMHMFGLPGGVAVEPVGQKRYDLTATQVRSLAMAPPAGVTRVDDLSGPAYAASASTLDTPSDPYDPASEKVSFFHGAADVVLV